MSIQEIKGVCLQFLKAYENRNLDTLSRIINNSEDLVVLGTHKDLHFFGWSAFRTSLTNQFSVISETRIRITDFHCRTLARETTACATLITDYHGKISGRDVCLIGLRLTLSLEKEEDSWRILQIHWSAPQNGSLLNPEHSEMRTLAAKQQIHSASDDDDDAISTRENISHASREAFSVYQRITQCVTESINQGRFDFTRDIQPHVDASFIEIVEGVPLPLSAVRESFIALLDAVASGAIFSWTIELERACDLAADTVLLITTAHVTLSHPAGDREINHYRISNILQKETPVKWVFLHQHRTTLARRVDSKSP
ncbi:nuclear transport factor 2 family protein [Streptomyces sp. NPDC002306]